MIFSCDNIPVSRSTVPIACSTSALCNVPALGPVDPVGHVGPAESSQEGVLCVCR